jgi:hypothetical protein
MVGALFALVVATTFANFQAGFAEVTVSVIWTSIVVAIVAFLVYLAGLILLAWPLWVVLDAVGLRHWAVACALGAVLHGGVVALLTHFDVDALPVVAAASLAGALIGFVIWRHAYLGGSADSC